MVILNLRICLHLVKIFMSWGHRKKFLVSWMFVARKLHRKHQYWIFLMYPGNKTWMTIPNFNWMTIPNFSKLCPRKKSWCFFTNFLYQDTHLLLNFLGSKPHKYPVSGYTIKLFTFEFSWLKTSFFSTNFQQKWHPDIHYIYLSMHT